MKKHPSLLSWYCNNHEHNGHRWYWSAWLCAQGQRVFEWLKCPA